MKETIVIGGSGFIGKTIQEYVIRHSLDYSFAFSYRDHPEAIRKPLRGLRLSLLEPRSVTNELDRLDEFDTAIYVSGNNNHGLASSNPEYDLDMNARSFLRFCDLFSGKVTVLSSQAVYYGLDGEIDEQVDHSPTVPYAISKKAAEMYGKFYFDSKKLDSLWIHRLMYAFGEGERPSRLVSACGKAARTGEKINIAGGGRSFLNPLPASFVAAVMVRSSQELMSKNRFCEITNLNHPSRTTVLDVVEFLNQIKPIDYTVLPGGEEQPVSFWGRASRLSSYLKEWQMEFPSVQASLKDAFLRNTEPAA